MTFLWRMQIFCFLNHSAFFFFYLFIYLFIYILGLRFWHMEIPRLGVESELQLLTYTTATSMWGPSHVGDLRHGSQQHRIPNPLNEVRDETGILMDTSRIHCHWATTGTPAWFFCFVLFCFFLFFLIVSMGGKMPKSFKCCGGKQNFQQYHFNKLSGEGGHSLVNKMDLNLNTLNYMDINSKWTINFNL